VSVADPATIEVELAYSPQAGEMLRRTLSLPAGATVAQAVAMCGWVLPEGLRIGIWGRLCATGDDLRDRDRVELYRALAVDPKEARRQRYVKKAKRRG
jgi:putative ubiquitin-RnfH superfamily antitoxin RatB of RatAB toxin-antitoxin module